jgi:hypothetical protein
MPRTLEGVVREEKATLKANVCDLCRSIPAALAIGRASKEPPKSPAGKGNSLIFPRHLPSLEHDFENGALKS